MTEGELILTNAHYHAGKPCRVCGFQNAPQPGASVIKCECCGVRIGLDDQRPADIALWRAKFISNGGKWQNKPPAAQVAPARE
jgi:hypothetical protein